MKLRNKNNPEVTLEAVFSSFPSMMYWLKPSI